MSFVTGQARATHHLRDIIDREEFESFDDLLDNSENVAQKMYEDMIDEMMDLTGFSGSRGAFIADQNSDAITEKRIRAGITLVGYSERDGEMKLALNDTDKGHEFDVASNLMFGPSGDGHTLAAYYRLLSDFQGSFKTKRQFIKTCMGEQYLHGRAEGHEDHSLGGGDMQFTVLRSDKSILTFFDGNMNECIQLAKDFYENKQERGQGSREDNQGRKVGRNQPCPCGSGKKFKRCCGQG